MGRSTESAPAVLRPTGDRWCRCLPEGCRRGGVQGEDFVFDRTASDEAVDRDWSQLTHAMRTIGRLILDCWIPPRIHVQHVIGGRQIQACSASFQADQKHVALTVLKRFHTSLPLFHRCRAIQILVLHLLTIQLGAQDCQVIHKLTEDQCLVFVLQQFVDCL